MQRQCPWISKSAPFTTRKRQVVAQRKQGTERSLNIPMLCFRTNVKGNLKRCKQFEQHMQSNRLIKRLGCDAKSHPLTPTPHAVRLSQHCSNKFTTQLGNPDDVAPKNSTASPTSVNILANRTMTHHGSELVCTSHNGTSALMPVGCASFYAATR